MTGLLGQAVGLPTREGQMVAMAPRCFRGQEVVVIPLPPSTSVYLNVRTRHYSRRAAGHRSEGPCTKLIDICLILEGRAI